MHSPEDDESLDRVRDEQFRKDLLARLPEPLRFVADLPDLDALDATETIEYCEKYLAKLIEQQDLLIAHKLDAKRMIADMESRLKEARAANQAFEDHEDKYLHKVADLADAQHELFRMLETRIKDASENDPFNPQLAEWKEQLEELRKHMPKE